MRVITDEKYIELLRLAKDYSDLGGDDNYFLAKGMYDVLDKLENFN